MTIIFNDATFRLSSEVNVNIFNKVHSFLFSRELFISPGYTVLMSTNQNLWLSQYCIPSLCITVTVTPRTMYSVMFLKISGVCRSRSTCIVMVFSESGSVRTNDLQLKVLRDSLVPKRNTTNLALWFKFSRKLRICRI